MEELLPLIIGILWLVYTFYSRGQKKKTSKRSPSQENGKESRPSFLEQLLSGEGIQIEPEEPILYEEEEYEEPTLQPLPVQKKTAAASPFLKSELRGFKEEGQAQFDFDDLYNDSEISDQSSGDKISLWADKDFDLKQAVIYNAILDAPYIDYK